MVYHILLSIEYLISINGFLSTDEVYGNTAGNSERMGEFAKGIEEDTALYTANRHTIARGLKLIQFEIKEHKKKMKGTSVECTINSINQHISRIFCSLREHGVNINNLQNLPSLKYLFDEMRVHFSHQHWVEDGKKRWNLPGL